MKDDKITTYTSAVTVIKAAILKSPARAAQAVNQELLALYYGIGRYILLVNRPPMAGDLETAGNSVEQLKALLHPEEELKKLIDNSNGEEE